MKTLHTVMSLSASTAFGSPECWLDALYLVITGLSLFSGSLETYSALSRDSLNISLVSLTVVVLHLIFLGVPCTVQDRVKQYKQRKK